MFAPFITDYGKKWYFITASYAFGQDINKSFRELLAKMPAAPRSATTKCR